ncbi:RNA polymerase sigma factor [Arthrobacter sp. 35W]|uniref:RNA polymerase sigma factor n=1 Tax=Arthrobacter sp. 35W TaxID=1132441 RepID=UPI000421DBEE|nr:sigma-70 family RNA polymerase sigma factor [Arthrobacter sp. 35W]
MLSERELAFIALHKDCYPRIFRFVRRRVNDAEVAQELAADVFRVAWQKWDEAPVVEPFWLFTVARNLLGNAYRSHERQQALQVRLRESAATESGPDADNALVDEAMAGLREKDRDILQLAYWDDLTIAEIAGVLRCSESAAKVRLHRAREAFRKRMPAPTNSLSQKMGA